MQEKLQNKLAESEARYRRLFETARDGIIILDYETGQIADVNPFLEQLLGYSKKQFLHKKLWEVGAFKNMKLAQGYFKVLQEAGYVRYDNLPLEASDGRQIPVEFVSNVYMAGGTRVIQCNIRDISDRRRHEAEMENKKILEAEKIKGAFVSDATHELRTPLAIIKGNVDLALRAPAKDAGAARSALRKINKEVIRLAVMLSDLTNYTTANDSSHKTGHFSMAERVIVSGKVDLLALIKLAVARCKTLAGKKEISIKIAKNFPEISMMGDELYLEKLFINIINNAIIYGKQEGKVLLSGVKTGNILKIMIADDGQGIGDEDLPHIFDRFYRVDKSRGRSSGGTGLGLSISKWIAEAHGGNISAASIFGKGTIFTITLPMRSAGAGSK